MLKNSTSSYIKMNLYILSLVLLIKLSSAVELTFELPDNAKECFHEEIEKDIESTLEFQVFYIYYRNFGSFRSMQA